MAPPLGELAARSADGEVYFTAEEAKQAHEQGERVVLVRLETSPEDIEGMHAAEGILTVRGGMTSHAAVVARGMGTACISGCGDIVIDEKKNYIGGMIYPGVNISLNALTENASQLQGIGLEAPKRIVGKNTIECMKSGVLYSNAAALDGIIDRIEEELGEKATVVATGGLAKKIVPHCKREIILDEELLLRGLLIIYEKNK